MAFCGCLGLIGEWLLIINNMKAYLLLGMWLLSAIPAMAENAVETTSETEFVKKMIPMFERWARDEVLVDAVEKHNLKKLNLEDIKKKDRDWISEDDLTIEMKDMMSSDAAKQLYLYESLRPYFFEIFLTGKLGANVAMTNRTSDYWQGDEAKFINAYDGGLGRVYIEPIHYDKSSHAFLTQVSLPVKSQSGEVIGVLIVGVNVDEMR